VGRRFTVSEMIVEEFSGKNENSTFLEKMIYTLDITFTPVKLFTLRTLEEVPVLRITTFTE